MKAALTAQPKLESEMLDKISPKGNHSYSLASGPLFVFKADDFCTIESFSC